MVNLQTNMAKLLLCLTLLTVCSVVIYGSKSSKPDAHHWDYTDFDAWCHYSKTCCAEKQSPIDLKTGGKYKPMKPFNFINYSKLPNSVTMVNNGHTVVVSFTGETIKVEGGGLPHTYIFHSLHFHWGKDNSKGAEHTVDEKRAPLEMHLVHYNSKHSDLGTAIASDESDALAVLGVLYTINDKGLNPELQKITSQLSDVKFNGKSAALKPFTLRKLLPTDTKHFFRYMGSLTTPKCNEEVVWTVFQNRADVTNEQMKNFRSVFATAEKHEPKQSMSNNYRPVQSLKEREVILGEEKN